MKEERTCQNCKSPFVIEDEDFQFYKKIDVPPPTWCPECRLIRRFSFTNIWNLHKRKCSKCEKQMISIFPENTEFPVYCQPCWWADDWDGTEFQMEYDLERPFLDQMKELTKKTPYMGLESAYLTNVNSDYTNASGHTKNCYMTFWSDFSENSSCSVFLNGLRDSMDCYRMKESELCYEVVGGNKCYKTFFSEECDSCSEVWFSRGCTGCVNCFGCVNLRNKNYRIFNKQYSKEEYQKKLSELDLTTHVGIENARRETLEFWSKHPRRVYIGNTLNVSVTGDYVYESKNAKGVYMSSGVEDSRFVEFISVPKVQDSYDYSGWGNGATRIYESSVVGEGADNIRFSNECWPDVMNVEYSMFSIACKNIFGCVNLKRKQYCILNKEYPKEEYEKLVATIREDMEKHPYVDAIGRAWKYGEFLPLDFSPTAYNESISFAFFPKTKEDVLKEGMEWQEEELNEYTITKQAKELPDSINSTDGSILDEVVACEECGRAYKIVRRELDLLKKLLLPVPHSCWMCRQRARFARTNPPRFYDRACMKCGKAIRTAYAPEREEVVYCEVCYQSEVV